MHDRTIDNPLGRKMPFFSIQCRLMPTKVQFTALQFFRKRLQFSRKSLKKANRSVHPAPWDAHLSTSHRRRQQADSPGRNAADAVAEYPNGLSLLPALAAPRSRRITDLCR